jgi:hypothetical protein
MSRSEPLNWELSAVSFGIFISPWGRWASGNDGWEKEGQEKSAIILWFVVYIWFLLLFETIRVVK